MSVIGEAFLSAIIGKVVEVGFGRLVDECKWCSSIKSELVQLERHELPRIKAVVEAAESGDVQVTDALRKWLWSLKDVLYEADDLLDDLKYLDLRKQVVANCAAESAARLRWQQHGYCSSVGARNLAKSSASQVKKAANFCRWRIPQLDPTLRKLREVITNLRQVAAAPDLANFYNLIRHAEKQQRQVEAETIRDTRVTTAMLAYRGVLGRDAQKDEVIQWLVQPEDDLRLFSIVGHGGMGKTTLTKFIVEDESLESHFDLVMWAYVSPSFNVERITREMLGSTKAKRPEFDTFIELQTTLKTLLTSSEKKFLLVLDDAWDDRSRDRWENLLAPLKFASKGGRILLTTRSETVARMAEQALTGVLGEEKSPMKMMTLRGLDRTEYLQLFNRHAFLGKDRDSYPWMKSVGEQIANKLGGSPLLAKIVGAMLNQRFDVAEYWRTFLARSIPGDILSNLRLSYHYLPPDLRPCFAYCSVLQREDGFSKQDVVRLWMANGLIQEDSPGDTMEMVGNRYFDDLLRRSFFETDTHSSGEHNPRYNMHDLLLELALSVTGGECFRFTDDNRVEDIPKMIRHLLFETRNLDTILKTKAKWKKLRTLVFSVTDGFDEDGYIRNCKEALGSLASIRVLAVHAYNMNVLSDTIGGRRHLRYVFTNQSGQQLARFLSKLYHLQTLRLLCHEIPLNLKNLISLRHVEPAKVLADLRWIGKLTSLQELEFNVRQEIGVRIGELKGLEQLHELSIRCIENVRDLEEAREARIHEKEHIRALSLSWCSEIAGEERHEQVLEGLKPNSGLKDLTIEKYMGREPPSWMGPESLRDVQQVKLGSCSRLAQLSPLGRLACLTSLYLKDMAGVKRIGLRHGFQQLQVLEIIRLEQWEEWRDEPGAEASVWCPRLRRLVIRDCPMLAAMPALPLCLAELELGNVNLTALSALQPPRSDASSPSSASISKVSIQRCPKLESLAVGLLQEDIPALEQLEIEDCEVLSCLPGCLSFLKLLSLKDLPFVEQIDIEGSFPRLEILKLANLEQMEELCRVDANLKELRISKCPKLNALPSIPLCLEKFSLESVGFTALPRLRLDGDNDESGSSSSAASSRLSELKIERCSRMVSLADGLLQQQHHLRALATLSVVDCKELVCLPEGGFRRLSSLWSLGFRNCPKLQLQADAGSLIPPSALKSFTLTECGEMESSLNVFLHGAISLNLIVLSDCHNLTLLPGADVTATWASLQILTIDGCGQLTSLGGLDALHRLDRLAIRRCPKLVGGQPTPAAASTTFSLHQLEVDEPLQLLVEPLRWLNSVEYLEIRDCSSVESLRETEAWLLQNRGSLVRLDLSKAAALPTCIGSLSSLQILWVFGDDRVQSLPQLPPSLKHLHIWGCDVVLERLRRKRGADWLHVRHIPYVRVSGARIS